MQFYFKPSSHAAAWQIWAVFLAVAFEILSALQSLHVIGDVWDRSHWQQAIGVGWESFNSRPSKNVKKQRRLCLEPKSKLPNFSALDVDSADRPSDTNLIKVGGKCESQTETHHNFPAHLPSFRQLSKVWLSTFSTEAWGGKLGATIADVIKWKNSTTLVIWASLILNSSWMWNKSMLAKVANLILPVVHNLHWAFSENISLRMAGSRVWAACSCFQQRHIFLGALNCTGQVSDQRANDSIASHESI